MDIQGITSQRIDVLPQRSQQPGQVWRAAGTAEPLLPHRLDMALARILLGCLGPYLQGIYIKEVAAIHGHASQYDIVEGLLDDICILPVSFYLQHAMGKKD